MSSAASSRRYRIARDDRSSIKRPESVILEKERCGENEEERKRERDTHRVYVYEKTKTRRIKAKKVTTKRTVLSLEKQCDSRWYFGL